MFRVAMRGLLAHKLRVLLSSLSIALGVAFVTGTLVLTDSMNTALTSGYEEQYDGTDVVVRAPSAFEDSEALDQRTPIPASVLDRVYETKGVVQAEGSVTGFTMIVDRKGEAITREGAKTEGTSAHEIAALAGNTQVASGRMPVSAGEMAMDASTAKSAGFVLGDTVRVLTRTGSHTLTLVGTAKFGDENNFAGNTTAFFNTRTAQNLLGKVGQFDEVRVDADAGVNAAALRSVIEQAVPKQMEVVTGATAAKQAAKTVKDSLSFVNAILLTFAFIAIFVGSFIIWNTFSILVAQRSRELALLRAVGASRRQVRRSMTIEALAVGTVASVIGIAVGVGLASGLKAMLSAFGLTLPSGSAELRVRTIIVGMCVGVIVTLVASMAPSRKATKIAPVAALRDSGPQAYAFSKVRLIVSCSLLAISGAALIAGLYGAGISLVGLGALGVFLGMTAVLPLISRPISRVLGVPLARFGGSTGELARGNAMRNPKRTASTAAALMIGLSLVAAIGVLAASLKASINSDVDANGRAEIVLTDASGSATMSPAAADEIRGLPGVGAVSEFTYAAAKIQGERQYITPYDPTTIEAVLDLGIKSGVMKTATGNEVFVYDTVAKDNNYKIGDTLKVDWPQTGASTLRVAGTFSEKGAVGSEFLIPLTTYDKHVAQRLDSAILVKTAEGASPKALQAAITAKMATAFPNVTVNDLEGYKDQVGGLVDKFLALVIVLLALAVIIALLGIVNTLALSVFERTRELGLLRAVGMTRRQVREMVRYESVIISVLGAVMGIVLGIGFGLALTKALEDDGISVVDVPVLQMIIYVVLAGVAGVVAAIGPARSAANVDTLKAVVTE
jgi:putative ABC transport system permease protein